MSEMAPGPGDGTAGPRPVSDDFRRPMAIGLGALMLLVFGLGGWAATANLSGAILAEGTVVVDSSVKKVQHPNGGIVGEILVRDGDSVAAGDLLLRLDDTITKANLAIVSGQLDELAIRHARLTAERDGAEEVAVPVALAGRMDEAAVAEIVEGETGLFASRHGARDGQRAQLRERIAQLGEEIDGLIAQEEAKGREIGLIEEELVGLHDLEAQNLVPASRVKAMERESARIGGERAQLIASAAQARGRIAEIELQIIQLDQDLRTEVMEDLREVQAKRAELEERRIAAEDQLKRIEIRSPRDGIVHQLAVHTVGGVIEAGESVMLIVPQGEALVIEARVAPRDIDNVIPGQTAFVRFPAFNQRTTPEFIGSVTLVAADLTREPQSGLSYFVVRITLPQTELAKMGELKLVPGMPAEVHITTGERTALSYLMKPLTDQVARAFQEE